MLLSIYVDIFPIYIYTSSALLLLLSYYYSLVITPTYIKEFSYNPALLSKQLNLYVFRLDYYYILPKY